MKIKLLATAAATALVLGFSLAQAAPATSNVQITDTAISGATPVHYQYPYYYYYYWYPHHHHRRHHHHGHHHHHHH